MPNRHAGICYKCGEPVDPGAGVFEKVGRPHRVKWGETVALPKWLLQHHECVRKYPANTHYIINPAKAQEGV